MVSMKHAFQLSFNVTMEGRWKYGFLSLLLSFFLHLQVLDEFSNGYYHFVKCQVALYQYRQ